MNKKLISVFFLEYYDYSDFYYINIDFISNALQSYSLMSIDVSITIEELEYLFFYKKCSLEIQLTVNSNLSFNIINYCEDEYNNFFNL